MANLLPVDSSHRGIYENELQAGSRWYFSRKELEEKSPSNLDGIDLKKETYLRKSYCSFLQDLGMRLKVPQITIATAIIFCHRFFIRQSHAKNDRRTIATVCMFLAGKVEETPRLLKDVILVSYEIIHKKDKDPDAVHRIKQKRVAYFSGISIKFWSKDLFLCQYAAYFPGINIKFWSRDVFLCQETYELQKELILLGERVVLSTLGYDLNVLHPYKPLVEAIKKFKVAQNALAQVAWNFVNDGLRTSLCLQFKPHHIAAAAIFLAAKFLKVKLPSDGDRVWWQEFEVTPRQLEQVSNQMLELYEQNRLPPCQGEVEGSTGSGGTHQASSKAQSVTEEYPAMSSYSQASITTSRPGPLKPSSTKPVPEQPLADICFGPPRTAQSQYDGKSKEMENATDDDAYAESQDDRHCESEIIPYQNKSKSQRALIFGRDAPDMEGQERIVVRSETRDVGELKDKHFGRNLERRGGTVGQLTQEAIKKLDTDKFKAAVEKQRKLCVDRTQKTDLKDKENLIEREVEDGIEQEYKNSYHDRHQEDARKGHREMRGQSYASYLENVEEGEVSVTDDVGRGSHSPKLSNRKRKVESPPERALEGRSWHNYGPGSHRHNYDYVEDRNRMSRLGYMERDHKRHVPENHV